jgi:hypothetical protein
MDMNQLLGLLQIYPPGPPARPGRTQALRGEVWPGHGLPERGAVPLGTGNLHDPSWEVPLGNIWTPPSVGMPDDPSTYRTLEMPFEHMTPETSARIPRVPTAEDYRASFDPQLRIGTNEPAQRARASREGRAADLMRLLDAYDVMPGQEKWF